MVYRSLRTQTVAAYCTYAVQKSLRLISTTATFVESTSARSQYKCLRRVAFAALGMKQSENKLWRSIVVERLSRQRTALARTQLPSH